MSRRKKKQEAQEIKPAQQIQEATQPEQAQEAPITERQVKLLIMLAAQKTGKPREEIDLATALDILDPQAGAERRAAFERAADKSADKFIETLTAEDIERLQAAAQISDSEYQRTLATHIIGNATAADLLRDFIAGALANDPEVREVLRQAQQRAQEALQRLTQFMQSETYKALHAGLERLSRTVEELQNPALFKDLQIHSAELQDIVDLAPYLELALSEAQADLRTAQLYEDTTVEDIDLLPVEYLAKDAKAEDFTDEPLRALFDKYRPIIERAWQLKEDHEKAAEAVEELERAAKDLPRIISNPTELLTYPLDKPNSIIWNWLQRAGDSGQIGMDEIAFNTGKKNSGKKALVYYGINFDELGNNLTITRQLTPFDKRVYIATAALFNGGNTIVSATQIYKMMGNNGNPKAADVQRINDSLTKMGAARVYIDSTEEVETNKRYPAFKYDASLLPFERISAYINNTLCEAAIHIFREPPLITFARDRGQITGITRQLLESPVSKTDANLRLDDYLLERIGHMKNPKGKAPRKMLLTTIYDHCGITSRMQRNRAPEKIKRYLEHYKSCGWISDYKMEPDSITIVL